MPAPSLARTPAVSSTAIPPELSDVTGEELLQRALDHFGPDLAVVTALQAEGMVLVDMALRRDPETRVATIDTGRLPAETHAFVDAVRAHYGRDIEVIRPAPDAVVDFVGRRGPDAFYISPELRLECCHIRKVVPLDGLLDGVRCWVSGLRRGQSPERAEVAAAEADPRRPGVVKLNPLADWSEADVAAYTTAHRVPRHPLYAAGYPSIGCAPCTRAVPPGASPRAGRWWWEQGIETECGIHGRPRVLDQAAAID